VSGPRPHQSAVHQMPNVMNSGVSMKIMP
jgi:hypothetical protein